MISNLAFAIILMLAIAVCPACAKTTETASSAALSVQKNEPPLSAAELLNLGQKYLLGLDYQQALVYFNKVIEIEPKNFDAWLGLSRAYRGSGQQEEAVNALRIA